MLNKTEKFILAFGSDYRGLIVLFFILRLCGITDPPLEIQHSWRQCTGLMIARNFLCTDANVFYPRVDDLCFNSGIIGFEFPIMNYLHFLVAKLFGYTHWYGRLINLLVSSIGLYYFGKLIELYFDKKLAWFSVFALLASPWLIFSRKMMPDTFSISLMFIGLYYAERFYRNPAWYHLALFFVFSTLGGLAKIPAAIYFGLVIYFTIRLSLFQKRKIITTTLLSLFLIFLWYFIWGPYLSEKYGNWTNLGKPFMEGVHDLITHPKEVLDRIIFSSFNSYVLFVLMVFGIYKLYTSPNRTIKICISILLLTFLIYICKAGFFFYHHNYYMIPIIPVLAFSLGYGIYTANKKYLYVLFFIGVIESIANQQHDFRIKRSEYYKLNLKTHLDSLECRGKKSPILINTAQNPQLLYLADRKGCYINEKDMQDSIQLMNFKSHGYQWMVIDKRYAYINASLREVFNDTHFIIYAL